MEGYQFVQTDHAYLAVYNEDTGILFRNENGCLYGATPPGGPLAAHAEDWKILTLDTNGKLTEAGTALEHECDGIVEAAQKALKEAT